MPTRNDLRQMIGEELGVVAAGEELNPEDRDYILRREESKLAELYEDGLIPFDQDGTIPQAYMLPLAKVVAGECAAGYGLDVATAKALSDEGMKSLRKIKAPPYFPATSAVYY